MTAAGVTGVGSGVRGGQVTGQVWDDANADNHAHVRRSPDRLAPEPGSRIRISATVTAPFSGAVTADLHYSSFLVDEGSPRASPPLSAS